jgi:thiol reductant ABC exporter CydC subunit
MLPMRWWIALAVLLSFGTLGASIGLMAMSAYLISKAALVTAFADVAVVVTAVRFFAIARAALRYAERYVGHLTTFRILTRLRVWFYTSIEPLAPARLSAYHSGDLYARISSDIETLENFYVRAVVPPLAAALAALVACLILGAFDLWFAIALAIFMLVTGVALPLVTQRLSRKPSEQFIAKRAELTELLTDEIQGIADVLALGQESNFQSRISALSRALDETQLRLANLRGLSNALAVLFAGLAGLTILFMAIPLVTARQLDGVFLALLPLTAIAAFEALQPLGASLQQLEASRASAKRLFELIDAQPPPEPHHRLPLPTNNSIVFNNVAFRYAPDEPLALEHVSVSVPHGSCLAVSGESGAGKSSLVNLLLRFWDAQDGQITVGGYDIRMYESDRLREMLGIATQPTYLFNGTLRDNLLVANGSATDQEIVEACRTAQLGEFVAALPSGLDTLVGENGLKLSGGERQRISIARVLLKNAPILILDEATANLDAITEREVMHALGDFIRSRTTVLISHRRAGFEYADRLITLHHGRLISQTYAGSASPVDASLLASKGMGVKAAAAS